MQHVLRALIAALLVPLALGACVFMPGRFESMLDIRADRSFAYSYKGEILAIDLKGLMGKAISEGMAQGAAKAAGSDQTDDGDTKAPDFTLTPEQQAKRDEEYREIAAKIAKETGYRQVEYRGKGVFYVDYAVSGTLTHTFVFPYNQDAEMVFPFVAVELRGKDGVRVKAPGFAAQSGGMPGMGGMGDLGGMASGANEGMLQAMGIKSDVEMRGTFTLTTDAEIVSQNNENGATAMPGGRKVTWQIAPTTKDAPMAMLRVKAS